MDNYEVGKMIDFLDLLLLVSEGLIVCCTGLLAYLSVRAFRRTGQRSMLFMAMGFIVILFGSLVEETIEQVLGYQLIEAHMFENFIVAIGFLLLVYSIYGTRN